MNKVKHLVSKNKRRFKDKEHGFDLDLSYVTDRIIAMGFPSEAMESMYRNSLEEVRRFLEERHRDKYKIYNLCSERSYDISKFHSRVAVFPFDDHSPPQFGQILPFCRDVAQWLEEDPDHVAVVHCKAGKGRTGLMICAFLLYSGQQTSAAAVLDYYGSKRTFDSSGVTLPSQRRYVDYFCTKLELGLQYSPVPLQLTAIILEPPPHVGFGHHGAHLQFELKQSAAAPFQSEVYTVDLTGNRVLLELQSPLLLSGDVKISFSQKLNVDPLHLATRPRFLSAVPHGKLFHFWINTFFIALQRPTTLSHDLAGAPACPGKFPSLRELPTTSASPMATPVRRRTGNGPPRPAPTPTSNRFAALSLPNLPAQFVGGAGQSPSDSSAPPQPAPSGLGAEEMAVRLHKDQIDKASKDHSDRFPDNFTVSLVVRKLEVGGQQFRRRAGEVLGRRGGRGALCSGD